MTGHLNRAASLVRLGVCTLIILLGVAHLPAHADAPDKKDAQAFVAKLVDEAVNSVIGADISLEEKEKRFHDMFVEAADIPAIAAFVVGREWRTASEDQRKHFVKLFEDVSVLTWLSHLDEYRGLRIEITDAYVDRRDVFVESKINLADGKPVSIVWRVQNRKDGLKMIDIAIESNSMLINTRKQYASVMKREGGLQGLITSLEKMRSNLRTAKTK